MIKHRQRILNFLTVIVPVIALIVIPKWTVDDAFISYRYGVNLAQAGELNWNLGDPAIEGYTGVLLPLLAALFFSIGINVITGIKVLGVLACLGTAWIIRKSLNELGVRPIIQALATLLFLLSPIVYVHALSGLETIIFTSLIASVLFFQQKLLRSNISTSYTIIYASLLLVGSLARPEGVLFALLSIIILLVAHARSGNRNFTRIAIVVALIFVAPGLIYFIWRIQYYGYLLPNSFAAKKYGGLINPESVKSAARFMAYYLSIPAGIALILALLGADRIKASLKSVENMFQWRTFQSTIWLVTSFMAISLLVYFRSELFMNYASRFFVPFYPLMIIISGGFIELGWQALGESKRNGPLRFRYTIILIWLAVTVQLSVFTFKWYSEMAFLKYYSAIVEEEYKPVAVFLKDNLREDATLISYMDAGAIPYYSGLRVIDFGRLNDLYLARKQPDLEKIVDYFFIQYADAVVMTSESEENYLYIDEAITIYNDPRFADFELAKVFGNSVNYPYAQWVFLRKGK